MMFKKIVAILAVALLAALLTPAPAPAASVTLKLNKSTASPGGSIIASGTADAGAWVSIKLVDSGQQVIFFDAVKSDASGNYSDTLKVPYTDNSTLTVVAGYGANVADRVLDISSGGGGGGGGVSTPQAVTSTTGSATLDPGAGGTVSLGSDASISIPAGALTGTTEVDIAIQKMGSPPAAPSGFSLLGAVYEFTVDGKTGYAFTKPVTLTFPFDPAKLAAGETPSVYYYDDAKMQWVSLGGTVSGSTIEVTVDHFTKFAVLAKQQAALPAQAPTLPPDAAASWAKDAIARLLDKGFITGYPDGMFRPDSRITRAEFVAILDKACGLKDYSTATASFTDVAPDAWYYTPVSTAVYAGIVKGYGSVFAPNDPVTREQMAVMVTKAAKIKTTTSVISFKDSDMVSAWARDALAAVVQQGIMKGYPDGAFNPQGKATRAEAAAVVAVILK